MKSCLSCHLPINEANPKEKYLMAITKLGPRIIAFECFHLECWKKFWNESVMIELEMMKRKSPVRRK